MRTPDEDATMDDRAGPVDALAVAVVAPVAAQDDAGSDLLAAYTYAIDDVVWVVEAEEPVLSEIFAALP